MRGATQRNAAHTRAGRPARHGEGYRLSDGLLILLSDVSDRPRTGDRCPVVGRASAVPGRCGASIASVRAGPDVDRASPGRDTAYPAGRPRDRRLRFPVRDPTG